jgi:hypothetical protein
MGEWALFLDEPRAVRRTPHRRFRAERVARYDPTIEVPFVLADAFAHQTRRVLRPPGLGLAEAASSPGGGRRPRAVAQAREWGGHE